MDLRQRKRLLNMPRFNLGDDARSSVHSPYSYGDIDAKGILGGNESLQDQINSIGGNPTGYLYQNATSINNLPAVSAKVPDTDQTKAFKSQQLQSGIGKGLNVAQGALSIFNGIQSSLNVKSSDQLLTEAGSQNQSVMGVNYDQQNAVDGTQDLKEQNSKGITNTVSSTVTGATTGAKIGGPLGAAMGGVVGLGAGLFGWLGGKAKLRKRIRNAKIGAATKAQFQRSSAMTTGLQNQYALRFGDTSTGILYS